MKRFLVFAIIVLGVLFLIFALVFFFRAQPASPGELSLEVDEVKNKDITSPITAIVSPYDQSWHNSSFFVTIEDVDNDSGLQDFISGKQGCEYLIEDIGTGFSQQGFRQCGETKIFISVGEDGVCSSSFMEDSFQGRCIVSSRAHDKAGNVSQWVDAVFYIDFMPPIVSKIDVPEVLFPGQEYDFKATVADRSKIDGCNLFVDEKSTGVFPVISPSPCTGGVSCAVSSFVILESPGNHAVFFACIDRAGNVARGKEATFEVFLNKAPTISACRVVPANGNLDTAFLFSAEAEDLDEDNLSFTWEFGDGTQSTQRTPRYEYSFPGTYMPKVTIFDPDGENVSCNTAWVVIEE